MNLPPNILIITDSAETRRRWMGALGAANAKVEPDSQSLSSDAAGDVLVTDRPLDADMAEARRGAIARGDMGVVAVGVDLAADVKLPADCTDRELVQCCRLLTEIVRLRRQQRRGDRARQVLSQLVVTDPLTGLANRRAWDDTWRTRVETAGASQRSICLAIMDLDNFKRVNEQRGFVEGDNVLRAAAHALQASVRGEDFVARLGGDEFALLLEDLPGTNAPTVVERLRIAICTGLATHGVTACAGLAVSTADEYASPDELFQTADERLRRAKSAGRNRTLEL